MGCDGAKGVSWSEGCEGYMGCTGRGAGDVRVT